MTTQDQYGRLTSTEQWFRYFMPYNFVKLDATSHKHVYLPLNRNYKPLGRILDTWVDYESFVDNAVVFAADPYTFKGVWISGGLYLYDDLPATRRDYFTRLDKLLSHSMPLCGLDIHKM